MRTRAEPLIAVIFNVPLLAEALCDTLSQLGECRAFAARDGDLEGLLRWIAPDAVVFDHEEQSSSAEGWARDADVPLVCVCMRTREVRAYVDGAWTDPQPETPEAIRNLVAGGLYGRKTLA